MVTMRAFSAAVVIDGEDLPCYQTDYDEDTHTVSCWIASEVDKVYAIRIDPDLRLKSDLSHRIYLDGSPEFIMGYTSSPPFSPVVLDGARVSATECRPFVFAPLQTTDDDLYLDSPALHSPGIIKVEVKRVRSERIADQEHKHAVTQPSLVVHEKSKKGLSHATRFGDASVIKPRSNRRFRLTPYTPADEVPWVTFIFYYRSAEILQAQGIMPQQSRSVSPLVPAPNPEEADLDAHKARIKALEAARDALEREIAAIASQGRPVKREHSPIRKLGPEEIEVIDLTSESPPKKRIKKEQGPIRLSAKDKAEVIDLCLSD